MKDMVYRDIFPNHNLPKIEIQLVERPKSIFLEQLSDEVNYLSNYADFSKVVNELREIEIKLEVEQDPINILLKKLNEFSNISKNDERSSL